MTRFDTTCSYTWPPERAGHGSALDLKRGKFWIFGGYRTYYPYLSTDSYGASKYVSEESFIIHIFSSYYLLFFFSVLKKNYISN